jgi:hypothetical protein
MTAVFWSAGSRRRSPSGGASEAGFPYGPVDKPHRGWQRPDGRGRLVSRRPVGHPGEHFRPRGQAVLPGDLHADPAPFSGGERDADQWQRVPLLVPQVLVQRTGELVRRVGDLPVLASSQLASWPRFPAGRGPSRLDRRLLGDGRAPFGRRWPGSRHAAGLRCAAGRGRRFRGDRGMADQPRLAALTIPVTRDLRRGGY